MRRTKTITIPGVRSDASGERDNGKTFIVTEMSADRAERWAIKALMALAKSGLDLGAAADSGLAGLASAGFHALAQLDYETVEPLLEEMWTCVQYVHNPKHPPQALRAGDDNQIAEVRTRLMLRMEVFKLHTDFFTDAAPTTTG